MLIHPDPSAPHEERARLLIDTDRYVDALDEIARAIRDRPQDVSLRLLAAGAYERIGALAEAADHLSIALAAAPEHLEANRRLAELSVELGDTPGAIRCWRRLVAAAREEDSDVVTLLAIALSKNHQHEAAIELLTKLTDKHPMAAASWANLGMASLAAGREDEALAAWSRALALDPQSAQAYCGLGLAHYRRERWEDAAAAFRETERLAPDSAVGSFNWALALERLGDGDGARRALLRAAALDPHDDEIQSALEHLLVHRAPPSDIPSSRDGGASIQGDLEGFELLDVIEFLRMQEKTGSLVVSAPAGVAILRLEQGMLIGGSAPRLKRLGEVLVRRGLLSAETLASALSRQRALHPGSQQGAEQDALALGAVLLREGLIDEKPLAEVLFRMILHVVRQITRWREGAFAFHPSENSGFPIRFNVQEVVLDLMRLEDERQRRSEAAR